MFYQVISIWYYKNNKQFLCYMMQIFFILINSNDLFTEMNAFRFINVHD